MKLIPRVVVLVFVASVVVAISASDVFAADIRVPEDYGTIQSALDAAANGDRILVSAGVYAEDLVIGAKFLTLQSTDGPGVTTIQGTGGASAITFYADEFVGAGGSITGFTITHGRTQVGGGLAVYGRGPVSVIGNIFEGNSQVGGGLGAAIAGWNSVLRIEQNLFRGNDAEGDTQFLTGVVSFVNSSEVVVANNVFVDNGCRVINVSANSGDTLVVNNTLVGNAGGILLAEEPLAGTRSFRNNIIVGNAVGVDSYSQFSVPQLFENNLVYGNTVDYRNTPVQTGVNGNLAVPPMFQAQQNGNLRLAPGSPAIDAGEATGAPGIDFDGVVRPVDGDGDGIAGFDIGAFEADESAQFDCQIQDDRTRDLIQFNSRTGAYVFTPCSESSAALSGQGTVRIVGGCNVQLSVRGTVQISAVVYRCQHRGNAVVRPPSPARTVRLFDSNTADATVACQ